MESALFLRLQRALTADGGTIEPSRHHPNGPFSAASSLQTVGLPLLPEAKAGATPPMLEEPVRMALLTQHRNHNLSVANSLSPWGMDSAQITLTSEVERPSTGESSAWVNAQIIGQATLSHTDRHDEQAQLRKPGQRFPENQLARDYNFVQVAGNDPHHHLHAPTVQNGQQPSEQVELSLGQANDVVQQDQVHCLHRLGTQNRLPESVRQVMQGQPRHAAADGVPAHLTTSVPEKPVVHLSVGTQSQSPLATQIQQPQMTISAQESLATDCYATLGLSLWKAGVQWECMFLVRPRLSGEALGTVNAQSDVMPGGAGSNDLADYEGAREGAGERNGVRHVADTAKFASLLSPPEGCKRASDVQPGTLLYGLVKRQRHEGDPIGTSQALSTSLALRGHRMQPSQQSALSQRLSEALKGQRDVPSTKPSKTTTPLIGRGSGESTQLAKRKIALLGPKRNLEVQDGSESEQLGEMTASGTSQRHETQMNLLQVSHWSLVEGENAAWMASGVRGKLIMIAEALNEGRMNTYEELQSSLASLAKHKGNADERVTALFLEALEIRRQGRGLAACSETRHLRMGHKKSSVLWFAKAHPTPMFMASTIMGMIFPKIAGKEKVHLFCLGYTLIAQLSVLVRMLTSAMPDADTNPNGDHGMSSATQHSEGQSACTSFSSPRLRKLRVTFIDPYIYPGRYGLKELSDWDVAIPFLVSDAESLGVSLQFDHLLLTENSADSLDLVEKLPGETTVACCAMELYAMCDDPGLAWAPFEKFMKALVRLQPAVVAMVNGSLEASQSQFVPRFTAALDFVRKQYESHDACTDKKRKGKRWQYVFEEYLLRTETYGIVSCEGPHRRIRPRGQESWDNIFEFWGFSLDKQRKELQESLATFVSSYPTGFGVESQDYYTYLTWQGSRLLVASSYSRTPQS